MTTETITKSKIEVKEPKYYIVMLHNDDFTPRDFVVEVLLRFFAMDTILAEKVMLTAHIKGKASCGRFTLEIAETKVDGLQKVVGETSYPLQFSVEPA